MQVWQADGEVHAVYGSEILALSSLEPRIIPCSITPTGFQLLNALGSWGTEVEDCLPPI